MITGGILFQKIFISYLSHTITDINFFAEQFDQACNTYIKALESGVDKYLVGHEAKPVFRKYV